MSATLLPPAPARESYLPLHLQEQNARSLEKAARRNKDEEAKKLIVCADGTEYVDGSDRYVGATEIIARELKLQIKTVLIPDEPGSVSEARRIARSIAARKRERKVLAEEMNRRLRRGEEVSEEDIERYQRINSLPVGVRRGIVISTKEPKTVTEEELTLGAGLNLENVRGHRNPIRRAR